jgi:iron complex outermembrane recepter protein
MMGIGVRNLRRSLMLSALALAGLVCAPALAQDTGLEDSQERSTIVVTARKQTEPLDRTATAVSVLQGHALAEGRITSPDQLAERFVGLTVMPNATGNLLFIRGVGGFTLTANSEPAVGWNYDGVFVARPMGTNGQMFDLDRVEFLKGPQGALHGRNATGGSINLVPRAPVLGETRAHLAASHGNFASASAEAMVNLPLGNQGAMRISALGTRQSNYLAGLEDGPEQFGLRVQLAARPDPDVSIRVAGDYTHLGGVGLGTYYAGKYVRDRATGRFDFIASNLDPARSTRSPEGQAFRETIRLPTLGRNLDAQQSIPGQSHDFYGAHAEIRANLGFAELTVVPAWRYADLLGIVPGPSFDYLHRETQEQTSLEARLAGHAGPVDWLAGVYLFGETVKVDYATNFSTSLSFQDQAYRTTSRSGFAQATINLSPALRLGGGLRVTDDHVRVASSVASFSLTCSQVVAGVPSCPTVPLLQLYDRIDAIPFAVPALGQPPLPVLVNGFPTGATLGRSLAVSNSTLNDTAITWRGTAEADLGSTALIYASVANGYRPGGTNTATGFETYRPEQLIAYTLGLRWHDPRRVVTAALEAFWWDYRDQHVTSSQPDLSTPPRTVNITRNIGRSRIRGFDLELDFNPAPLTVGFAKIEYLDARYLENTFPQVSTTGAPLTGCAVARQGTTTLYTIDCTGQRPFASPKWTLAFGLRQGIDIGRLRVTAMARTRYVSAMMGGTAYLSQQVFAARWQSHAQMMLSDQSGRFELATFVHNIEGNRKPVWAIFHPTSNALVVSTTQPRTYGVRAFVRF